MECIAAYTFECFLNYILNSDELVHLNVSFCSLREHLGHRYPTEFMRGPSGGNQNILCRYIRYTLVCVCLYVCVRDILILLSGSWNSLRTFQSGLSIKKDNHTHRNSISFNVWQCCSNSFHKLWHLLRSIWHETPIGYCQQSVVLTMFTSWCYANICDLCKYCREE